MKTAPLPDLPPPARYFPPAAGVYDVSPGLHPFGQDFGNGELDRKIFQFDRDFAGFRRNKQAARQERLGKYHLTQGLPPEAEAAVARFLALRLHTEWPALFEAEFSAGEMRTVSALHCRLTGETLRFDGAMRLRAGCGPVPVDSPAYVSAVDALISQVSEDFAVITRFPGVEAPEAGHSLTLLHVCSPSHWAPEEKLGLDFTAMHGPVPGFSRSGRFADALVGAMIDKGPYVRFVWSVVTDRRLNHHPEPPSGMARDHWEGPPFDPARSGDEPPFFLRNERQIAWGLPAASCGLFFIRVSFVDGREIRDTPELRDPFLAALRSMSPESRRYKGLELSFNKLTDWLSGI